MCESHLDNGGPLGADGEAVGGVLDVTAEHGGAVPAEQGGAHREAGVGGVGGGAAGQGGLAEGLGVGRHEHVSTAIRKKKK